VPKVGAAMSIERNVVVREAFNHAAELPNELRLDDFAIAMQDVYDFFYDVNLLLTSKGLQRLDDMLRPANMPGTISDMLSASIAKHSRVLVQNQHFNGHPDLIVRGFYANDSVRSGKQGIEIKTTRKKGGRWILTVRETNGYAFSCTSWITRPSRRSTEDL